jgi:hypothetical protein
MWKSQDINVKIQKNTDEKRHGLFAATAQIEIVKNDETVHSGQSVRSDSSPLSSIVTQIRYYGYTIA